MTLVPATAKPLPEERPDRAGLAVVAGYFAVYLGYGLALPVLPEFLREVLGLAPIALARHTGLVTAAYPLALAAAAPLWGLIAARQLGRRLYVAALSGYAASVLAFGLSTGLLGAYAARVAAGVCAGGISLAALTWAGQAHSSAAQSRRFVLLALAATVGLLMGPAVGGWLAAVPMAMPRAEMLAGGPLGWPFLAGAGAAVLAAAGALVLHPHRTANTSSSDARLTSAALAVLGLSLLGTAVASGFEVGLGLQAVASGIGAATVGNLFGLCGLTMGLAQVGLYLAGPPQHGRGWMRLAFVAGAAGLALTAVPAGTAALAASSLLVGMGAGFALPLLPYYTALAAGAHGPLQGLQVAMNNFGQALGAALVGWLVPLGLPAVWALAGAMIALAMVGAAFLPGAPGQRAAQAKG